MPKDILDRVGNFISRLVLFGLFAGSIRIGIKLSEAVEYLKIISEHLTK